MSSDLFKKEDNLTEEEIADRNFAKSYKKMESEVNRTSVHKFTLWGALTNFIYRILFGTDRIAKYENPKEGKVGMTTNQMKKLSSAFESVSDELNKYSDNSLTEKQIFQKTEKSLK
ncbi:MAG: hypothetical protein IPL26_15915 [Leptospiraceae bacterium]|nr:hypothetical protein [Leptospiraceae bacterium]